MGLALPSGGEFKPFVKYDAKNGYLLRVDRVIGPDGRYVSEDTDITDTAQFVADLENTGIGHIAFPAGQPPIKHLVPNKLVVAGKIPFPPQPADKDEFGKPLFKTGFEIDILLDNETGGGPDSPARIFNSNARCVVDAVRALHTAFEQAPECAAGKLPVVQITGKTQVKAGKNKNWAPVFKIIKWVNRPQRLPDATATTAPPQRPAVTTASATFPPDTGSTQVAPPPAARADASDFG